MARTGPEESRDVLTRMFDETAGETALGVNRGGVPCQVHRGHDGGPRLSAERRSSVKIKIGPRGHERFTYLSACFLPLGSW